LRSKIECRSSFRISFSDIWWN